MKQHHAILTTAEADFVVAHSIEPVFRPSMAAMAVVITC